MTFNRNYLKSAEGAIASYDYTDIAEGTGVVIFYGFTAKDDTTETFLLSTQASIYSNGVISSAATTTSGTYVLEVEKDFDIEFNRPQRIKGKGYATITSTYTHNTGNGSMYVHVKLRKWDGTTETEIADGQTAVVNFSAATVYQTNTVPLTIATQEHFKKGDILRITVEVYAKQADGSGTVGFLHDPVNRTQATEDTAQFINYIPFVLDI